MPVDAKELTVNLVVDSKPLQFLLPAKPLATDPAGKSSCFELADEKLCDGWDAKGATGRISLDILGKPYNGKIAADGEHKH